MYRHNYINILQQHLLPSARDIFWPSESKFRLSTGQCTSWHSQGYSCVARYPGFPADAVARKFPRYEHNRDNMGRVMDKLRNDPHLTIAELRQRVNQHWGEVTPQYLNRMYHIWLLSCDLSFKEMPLKHHGCCFCCNYLQRHHLRHNITSNLLSNAVLTSPASGF